MTEYVEVIADDFMTFSKTPPSYVKIESRLIEIGGNGVKGAEYKKEALNKAGWKYGNLISFGAHPKTAADAFNKVRKALESSNDGEKILEVLEMLH
ncbi:MAG: hypothetical protein JKY24_04505 [Pseudomonadales bacterium]|nr:hypothetical protein [Pseudomonadales bacterium]